MKTLIKYNKLTIVVLLMFVLTTGNLFAQATKGYNQKIPESIMTPDKVETRLGTLEFYDGMPTNETAQKVFDNLDFMRGVEVFLNFIPATSVEGLRTGMIETGVKSSNQILIFDKLMDANPLFLTGNTGTVYAIGHFDLEKDGPIVVEVPAGCGPGTVNDAFFRFVVDMGMPGPDRGQGGKYLILPPAYEGEVPEGYFVAKSTSYVNLIVLRGFIEDGKPDASTAMFKNGLKIYPLKDAQNPPEMEFISGSGKAFNTIHANTYPFYEELNHVIQKEPVSMLDPELRGLCASIGMVKGKEFNPDGSIDLYFGPVAPKGKEKNWTQTVPGKGWFPILRLYGPLEPWFEKTWRPGEFELVK